jgi:hypothetical protein
VPSLEVSEDLRSFYETLWASQLSPVPLLDSEPKNLLQRYLRLYNFSDASWPQPPEVFGA